MCVCLRCIQFIVIVAVWHCVVLHRAALSFCDGGGVSYEFYSLAFFFSSFWYYLQLLFNALRSCSCCEIFLLCRPCSHAHKITLDFEEDIVNLWATIFISKCSCCCFFSFFWIFRFFSLFLVFSIIFCLFRRFLFLSQKTKIDS